MKFSRMASLVCLLCLFPLSVPVQAADSLKISSTIGPVDAGILPLLADTFSKKTGIAISMEKAGTGKTLKKAESGTFDLVMVHARKLEDAFVAAGFGVDRRDVMYNDFVILGPAGDPAGIKGMKSAAEAFATIAKAGVPFVSRGDKSGTHVKEMDIWQAAGIQPAGAWYEVYADGAKGNKATTLYTDKKQAYTLMDRATDPQGYGQGRASGGERPHHAQPYRHHPGQSRQIPPGPQGCGPEVRGLAGGR